MECAPVHPHKMNDRQKISVLFWLFYRAEMNVVIEATE